MAVDPSDPAGAVAPPPAVGMAAPLSGARRLAAVRDGLKAFRNPNTAIALALLTGDLVLFAAGQALVLTAPSITGKLAGALVTWIAIVRLFLIGHDACHGALTGRDWLNGLLGRIAFLPSLTPFALWHVGHNVVHHGFNNLRGRDFVWEPLEPREFLALPAWRQALERLYRSGFGPGIYYLWEVWWKRLSFMGRFHLGAWRSKFTADCLLVTFAATIWIAGLLAGARMIGASPWILLGVGFVIPFLLWNWTVGLVIYLHHTAPDIRWFDNKRDWLQAAAQATATSHLTMPWPLGPLLHYIMEHPAHHLDGAIPLYRLKAAQRHLQTLLPELRGTRLTFRYYRECLRRCKVYDYARQTWAAFPSPGRTAPAAA